MLKPIDKANSLQDKRLLLLNEQDNCLVLRQALAEGTKIKIDGEDVFLVLPSEQIKNGGSNAQLKLGHKVARRAIKAGEKILRYGAVIGTASQNIAKGVHIHTHNLESDYLPTRHP